MKRYFIIALIIFDVLLCNTLIIQGVTSKAIARHNQVNNQALSVTSGGVRG